MLGRCKSLFKIILRVTHKGEIADFWTSSYFEVLWATLRILWATLRVLWATLQVLWATLQILWATLSYFDVLPATWSTLGHFPTLCPKNRTKLFWYGNIPITEQFRTFKVRYHTLWYFQSTLPYFIVLSKYCDALDVTSTYFKLLSHTSNYFCTLIYFCTSSPLFPPW